MAGHNGGSDASSNRERKWPAYDPDRQCQGVQELISNVVGTRVTPQPITPSWARFQALCPSPGLRSWPWRSPRIWALGLCRHGHNRACSGVELQGGNNRRGSSRDCRNCSFEPINLFEVYSTLIIVILLLWCHCMIILIFFHSSPTVLNGCSRR